MSRGWWVRLLLLVFPRSFRGEHREEVEAFVDSALDEAGERRARAVVVMVIDLLVAGVRLRFRPVQRPPAAGDPWPVGIARDVRLAARGLARRSGFTAVVIVTLALGIGLNTALFSVVNAVVLRPLDYSDPDRLVYLTPRLPARDIVDVHLSGGDLYELREVDAFSAVEGVSTIRQNLHGAGLPRQVTVGWVSGGFLGMLGVDPILGRVHREDDAPGQVVLSHAVWRAAFSEDPDVLGASIQLDGYPYTVIGVMPPDFELHLPPRGGGAAPTVEVWKNPDDFWENGAVWSAQGPEFGLIRTVARLRAGATIADAQAGVDKVVAGLRARFPEFEADGFDITIGSLHGGVIGGLRPSLLLLLGSVVVVLLIACANVANLLLVRGHARAREMALRLALGSSRGGVGRFLMVESLLLAFAGTVAGLGLAAWAVSVIPGLAPKGLPLVDAARLDGTVLAYATGAAVVVTLLVGVAPAWTASRTDPALQLGNGRVGAAPGVGFRSALVVAQLAFSVMLLVGAGLLTSSLARLYAVDPGFDASEVYTFGVSIPGSQYSWPDQANDYYRAVQDRVAAIPGVTSAGVVWPMPFSGAWSGEHDVLAGERRSLGQVSYRLATESYFPTVRIPLRDGRLFRDGDDRYVAVITEVVAERAWPGESAIGRRLRAAPWGRGLVEFEVIGVVGDVRDLSLREAPGGTIYFDARSWSWVDWEVHVVARTTMDEGALLPALREAVASVDEQVPLAHPASLQESLMVETAGSRFVLGLMAAFAVTAVLLALVGLYGVVSYAVGLRSREFGVRIALGSAGAGIRHMVVREAGMLAMFGLLIGLVGAVALSRLLDAFLFGVTARDPFTYMAAGVLLSMGAAIASWIPAWRVSRVDPAAVLRSD